MSIDSNLINLWSDREILPGEKWDSTIKNQLFEAELFLLLISADFFNSDYIWEKEFVSALQKLERGEAIIIPIIVRDCDWEAYQAIQQLQVLPPGGVAVTDLEHWKTHDKAWATVVREIKRRVNATQKEQQIIPPFKNHPDNHISKKDKIRWKSNKFKVTMLILALFILSIFAFWWFTVQNKTDLKTDVSIQDPTENPLRQNQNEVQSQTEFHSVENNDSLKKNSFFKPKQFGEANKSDAPPIEGTQQPVQSQIDESTKVLTKPIPGSGREKSGFQMVFVMGGEYEMGKYSEGAECNHAVKVKNFKIGKYELTQLDWFDVMGTRPSENASCDDCPVENVSWEEVQKFIQAANEKYGVRFRLPTEEEWEYAAKGGESWRQNKYSFNRIDDVAWYDQNSSQKTRLVGSKKPNNLGLFDLLGNVSEWCSNSWKNYPCDNKDGTFNEQNVYLIRGGSFQSYDFELMPEKRIYGGRRHTYRKDLGLRLAQD